MPRLRPSLAVLLSLLLLAAQQMAFAHMIGHIGPAAAAVTTAHEDDEGHGSALTLSHVCTTCVSAAGVVAGALPGVPPRLTFDGVEAAPIESAVVAVVALAPRSYLARAPPTVL